jgi:hypothetical protein
MSIWVDTVDISRYCPTRKFCSDLRCVETYLHRVQNTYMFYVGPNFTDCFVFHFGTLHYQSNYLLWGYSVKQRTNKQNVFVYRISYVVESLITIHSRNIMLGHTIKNRLHMISILIYNHLFEKWDCVFACFGHSRPSWG